MQARYLAAKLAIAERVLDVKGPTELVRKLFPELDAPDRNKIAQRVFKWKRSRGPIDVEDETFFENLHAELKYGDSLWHLMTSSAYEFFLEITDYIRQVISREELESILPKVPSLLQRIELDPLVTYENLCASLESSYEDGKIDQRFLYLYADSVRRWKRLIGGRKYLTHEDCLDALNVFLESEFWRKLTSNNQVDAVIDLGVGIGQKDLCIIESILNPGLHLKLKLSIIDTSYYMLEAALTYLKDFLKENVHRLDARAFLSDFTDLRRIARSLRGRRRATFFILGNTFANIEERKFMESISRVTRPDDLLVIGFETLQSLSPGADRDRTVSQFNNEHLSELVAPAIRSLDKNLVAGPIKPPPISGPHQFSDLQKAQAIHVDAEVGGKNITLAFSNRYDEDELVEFVRSYDFEYKTRSVSARNKNYALVLFQRVDRNVEQPLAVPS